MLDCTLKRTQGGDKRHDGLVEVMEPQIEPDGALICSRIDQARGFASLAGTKKNQKPCSIKLVQ